MPELREPTEKQRAYMSFGGGVQSTAIALLAIDRDERLLRVTAGVVPELYLFADTGDEPEAIYAHLEVMRRRIEETGAEFRVVRRKESLSQHIKDKTLSGHTRMDQVPFFVKTKTGGYGPVQRRCTRAFKARPMDQVAKRWARDKGVVQQWFGISSDEMQRLRHSIDPWRVTAHPLVDMNWHRSDCIEYLVSKGVDPIRSACVFCPFHSLAEWRRVASNPKDWAKAVEIDELIEKHGAPGLNQEAFVTFSGVRLRDLDLAEPENPQQQLWDNECAGICGV